METTLTELLEQFFRDKEGEIRAEIKKHGVYSEEIDAEELKSDYEDWIYELVNNFISDQDWNEWEQELNDLNSMLSQ